MPGSRVAVSAGGAAATDALLARALAGGAGLGFDAGSSITASTASVTPAFFSATRASADKSKLVAGACRMRATTKPSLNPL